MNALKTNMQILGLLGLVVLAISLVACSASQDDQYTGSTIPTSGEATAVETAIEHEPISTATASAPPTRVPTTTLVPSATLLPSPTSVPTDTPTFPVPSPTPRPAGPRSPATIENVVLSTSGQLAFINGDVLFVETEPFSGQFRALGGFAVTASWSPDGSRLFYSLANDTDEYDETTSLVQYVWLNHEEALATLDDMVTDYPAENFRVINSYWSPDGRKLVLQAILDTRHTEFERETYMATLVHIDLVANKVLGESFIYHNQRIDWLTNDTYILRGGCGSPCAFFWAFDYFGEETWRLPWDTGGFVDYSMKNDFMINVGQRSVDGPDDSTVDEIDLHTGNITEYWHQPRTKENHHEYFSAFYTPKISPSGDYFAFNWGGLWPVPGTLYVIDRSGHELGEFDNTYIIEWHEENLVTGAEITNEDQLRIFTMTPFGDDQTTIAMIPDQTALSSSWSPDNRYFAFSVSEHFGSASQLYVWDSRTSELDLVTHHSENYLREISWHPDSENFYFIEGPSSTKFEKIWQYDADEHELLLIVAGS